MDTEGWTVELHPHPTLPFGRVRDPWGWIKFDVWPMAAGAMSSRVVALVDAYDSDRVETYRVDHEGTRYRYDERWELEQFSEVGSDDAVLKLCRDAGLNFPRMGPI